jgi:nuclear transport factor 2 (NTF2) superfamily protein
MTTHSLTPPFTRDTAVQKVRLAEDAWNSRNPEKVALSYTQESRWRNRAEICEWTARDRLIPYAQVDKGTRLPLNQRALDLH